METLVIHSRSKSNILLLSELARKLGEQVSVNLVKPDNTETHFASQSTLAKEWLTPEEDKVWKDL